MINLVDAAQQSDDYVSLIEAILAHDNDYQISAALALLNTRSDLAAILLAAVQVMRRHMLGQALDYPALDIVGTGGDGQNTLNISTAAAIALAAAGIDIAKHGNRSVSSRCGSADVLEALGFPIEQQQLSPHLRFYFAPLFHPALKRLKNIRLTLGVPTIFNLLGPLLNPAQPSHAIIGVNRAELLPVYATVCRELNFKNVLLVHTAGTDELSCHANPTIMSVSSQKIEQNTITISELGLQSCTLQDLRGAEATYNAKVLRTLLSGTPHPATDTIILNVAAGLFVMGKEESLVAAVHSARDIIGSGVALSLLDNHKEIR